MREAIVRSALESAALAVDVGLPRERIILSAKVSGVQDLLAVYRNLAARCDYPLHLGLTEAGMGSKGIVASTAGIGVLLAEGIGDTIRVSLTPDPGGDRTQEVIVAQEILQTMGIRSFLPMVVACPGCGRTTSTYFQELASRIQSHIRHRMPKWRVEHVGVEELTVAVMGCVVNGPGESRHANIGISLPGTGERPVAPVYEDGQKTVTLKGERIAEEFQQLMEDYIARTYPRRRAAGGHHDRTSPTVAAFHARAASRRCRGSQPKKSCSAWTRTGSWLLDATSIQREFRFKDFFRTMSFVNAVAHVANIEDHHPDLEVGYDYCRVRYTTHAIGGLSENDLICAAKIDQLPAS